MLIRRYGSNIQSVEPNFQPNALTEIAFTRTDEFRSDTETFHEEWQKTESHEVTGETEGNVKTEVESALLVDLRSQLDAIVADAGEDAVVLVENGPGPDHPKMRDSTKTLVVAGENRLRFTYTVDPPLRVAVYRRAGA